MPFTRLAVPALLVCGLAYAPSVRAQERPTLVPADYEKWETPGAAVLSPDGRWAAWTVTRVDGDVALHVRAVAQESTRTIPHASAPLFSPDGRWVAWSRGVAEVERRQREVGGETVHSRIELLDLTSGALLHAGDFATAAFSADGAFVALRAYGGSGRGSDVVVRDLRSGTFTRLAGVLAHAWRDDGAVLALTAAAGANGSSLQLFDARTATLRQLAASDSAELTGIAWRPDHDELAVLSPQRAPDGSTSHSILLWRAATSRTSAPATLDPAGRADIPAALRIVDTRALRWSADGATLYFGVREHTAAPAAGAAGETAGVEIWHWADAEIVPEQKVQAGLASSRSQPAAWRPSSNSVVLLADAGIESVLLSDGDYAAAYDTKRYARERMFGPQLRDIHAIDVRTGARDLVAERVQYAFGISPGGRYILYVRDGQYWTFDTRTKRSTSITADLTARFINDAHDYPVRDKPPFGVGGWTPGDRSVLLHDRYDVWEVRPDGSGGERLTDGAAERVRHRRIWLHPDERVVDLSKPAFVALYGETTKRTGYARIRSGRPAERLLFTDAQASRLQKADSADVYMYRLERFDDSPDLFAGGVQLSDATQLSRTNPFQSDYAWGRAELIDFATADGRELQAALFYPANYQPGRQYPMIVDIYETVSNTLHGYTVPSEYTTYNAAVFTQDGYFVLRPDIAYRTRDPGVSAVESLVPAVERVLATGMVDREAIGLVGHSWGAYQTAFAITQTDLFSAAVAGAPLTNMISMYLSVFWNTGGTDARMFEIDQGRMEVPFWEDLDAYIRNSPVFHVERMRAPLLVAFGDRDGAVDWHQGIELYNAARRAGKELVLLVYEGENHSLARRPNQQDYHRRTNEWLAHYLKGAPAPDWITRGVPHAERQRELDRIRGRND
jgi:dipeptidyl aminopeptidase/acylaminoacyl peptidase